MSEFVTRKKPYSDLTVTVADAATDSGAIDIADREVCGVTVPTGLEGTTLGFKVATALAGTYNPLMSAGAAVSLTIAASRYIALDPALFRGVRFLKLVLAAQTGPITLTLHTR
jgi:hypothetical protein